jgi:hypothetical protein
MYLYTTSPYSEHRGNRILFPPFFPRKQKPISVSIFPVPPGHWLASLLVQHTLTIRDSWCLTGARTCTLRHHTRSTAETGSCFPHFFPWKQKPVSVFIFPVPPGHWLASLLVQHALTIRDSQHLTGARTCTPRLEHCGNRILFPPFFSLETETRFRFHFSSTSRPLVGIVAGAARFDYQR